MILDSADDFFSRQKSPDEISADYDMPFAVEEPPAGEGFLLRRSHVRWLVREEIRLSAMRPHINHDNPKAMKAYYELLEEFNAVAKNCSSERVDIEAAKADIEPYREEIEKMAALEVEVNGWDKPEWASKL